MESDAIRRARNPASRPYEPVLATSRSFEDDLRELWAGGVSRVGGSYDPLGFAQAFEFLGRQMVLRSLHPGEIAALGLHIMVSTGTEPQEGAK